jgi:hypothetical protein
MRLQMEYLDQFGYPRDRVELLQEASRKMHFECHDTYSDYWWHQMYATGYGDLASLVVLSEYPKKRRIDFVRCGHRESQLDWRLSCKDPMCRRCSRTFGWQIFSEFRKGFESSGLRCYYGVISVSGEQDETKRFKYRTGCYSKFQDHPEEPNTSAMPFQTFDEIERCRLDLEAFLEVMAENTGRGRMLAGSLAGGDVARITWENATTKIKANAIGTNLWSAKGVPLVSDKTNVIVVTATMDTAWAPAYRGTTTFNNTLTVISSPLRATLAVQGTAAILNWSGGLPPFHVQHSTGIAWGGWSDLLPNAVPPLTIPRQPGAQFYRIVGQ